MLDEQLSSLGMIVKPSCYCVSKTLRQWHGPGTLQPVEDEKLFLIAHSWISPAASHLGQARYQERLNQQTHMHGSKGTD